MKKNTLLAFIVVTLFHTQCITAQSLTLPQIGNRYIEYFNDNEINIGQKQVWNVCEGMNSFMYLAVNDGLIVYDGVRWRLYKTPQHEVIRALVYDSSSERIYSAGTNEFGYWKTDDYGHMKYVQLFLNNETSYKKHDFWRIALPPGNKYVYFQSQTIIYKYEPDTGELTEIHPNGLFAYMHLAGNNIYVQDDDKLMLLTPEDSMEEICPVKSRIINVFNDT